MGVPRMTVSQYRKYTLISRPYYDDKIGVWIPNASVVRDVFTCDDQNNSYYHQMKDTHQSFEREEQALCFGLIIGRAWIDDHLSNAAVKSKVIYARCVVFLLLCMQAPDLIVRDIEDRCEALRSRIEDLLAS
jgi:hypothetical protein